MSTSTAAFSVSHPLSTVHRRPSTKPHSVSFLPFSPVLIPFYILYSASFLVGSCRLATTRKDSAKPYTPIQHPLTRPLHRFLFISRLIFLLSHRMQAQYLFSFAQHNENSSLQSSSRLGILGSSLKLTASCTSFLFTRLYFFLIC